MIVVKTNMEQMPTNCRECKVNLSWVISCNLCTKPGTSEIKKSCMNKRHKDCPLMEVKAESK